MVMREALRRVPGLVWLKRRLVPRSQRDVPNVGRPRDRGQPADRWPRQCERQPWMEDASFVLYRIIGNDLVPRHRKGQSRDNLRFILEHEPQLHGCEKRFVVNQIVDSEEEAEVLGLLDRAGYGYLHIPFNPQRYAVADWDIQGVPVQYAPHRSRFADLDLNFQTRIIARTYRHKNNSVMNNNGARNAALEDGCGRATWVLPFDGNCFFTDAAWGELREAVLARAEFAYHIVPMARVTNNASLLEPGVSPPADEEPQVLFRRDAELRFNPEFQYGQRPKVELLWRLGVAGKWDDWPIRPWDLPCPDFAPQAGQFGYAGWVARLDSGRADLEARADERVMRERWGARNDAIIGLLDNLDERYAAPVMRPEEPVFMARATAVDPESARMQRELRDALAAEAESALYRGPYSVVDKTTLPPSGNCHDYWHPAPYYWPHPIRLPGLPYVRRDGQRVPGTQLYEEGAERYDRTRLQRLFDDTYVLSLAAERLGDSRFGEHAARLVRCWFLEAATAMNPHLEYAQVRWGHAGNRGANWGVIEFKDLYYFLDAVRLLRAGGFLTDDEDAGFRDWLRQYLDWLRNSRQGRGERSAPNNHGTYYDLQVASIAAFLGDYFLLRDTLRDSRFRIVEQFRADGYQSDEMRRTTTAHYCCFNLQGWIHLAELAAAHGEDLWSFTGPEGQSLKVAMDWLLGHVGQPWPYQQIDAFNTERFHPIHYACIRQYGEACTPVDIPPPESIKPLFFPHDGIRPFWQLR